MKKIAVLLFALFILIPTLLLAQNTTPKLTTTMPVANFSASDTAICAPATITFADLSTNSPTSWKWTFIGGNPDTSLLETPPDIYYSAAGFYNVTLVVTNSSGKDSVTKTKYVHVYALPNVTFTQANSLCQFLGGVDTITATGGTSYYWCLGETTSSIILNPPVSYICNVSVHNGACILDTFVTVLVDTMPNVRFKGDTSICVGDSTIISVVPGSDYTYLWNTGATTNSIFVNGATPGFYTYYVTVTKGNCKRDSDKITVHVNTCTGIENYSTHLGIEISPSPATNQLAVIPDKPLNENGVLSITDVLGRQVYREDIIPNQATFNINISYLLRGIYFLKLQANQWFIVKKFIKE